MAFGITQQVWTTQLNASSIVIDSSYGLTKLSIVLNSGTGTISGGAILTNGVTSAPIDLVIGQPFNCPSSSGTPLNDITITTTGIIAITGLQ